ncbi:MAG: hypothetical protein WB791_10765 [Waddliaceae bacterium]
MSSQVNPDGYYDGFLALEIPRAPGYGPLNCHEFCDDPPMGTCQACCSCCCIISGLAGIIMGLSTFCPERPAEHCSDTLGAVVTAIGGVMLCCPVIARCYQVARKEFQDRYSV